MENSRKQQYITIEQYKEFLDFAKILDNKIALVDCKLNELDDKIEMIKLSTISK